MRDIGRRRGRRAVPGLAAALLLSGCGAAAVPDPTPTPSPRPSVSVSTPSDGVSLAAFGFTQGPVDRVFLPLGVRITAAVDQPNNTTVVATSPSASVLAAYLRRTLPGHGFTLTADDPASNTLAFTGWGYVGRFTGDAQASALLLRPAPG